MVNGFTKPLASETATLRGIFFVIPFFMYNITYQILPPTLRSSWNPVVRFLLHEPEWPDPATYDVKADETGFCWMQGHRVLYQSIPKELEREAWEKAREEGERWLREFDELPF